MDKSTEKYIFPEVQLMHVSVLVNSMTRGKLKAVHAECLRKRSIKTLWHWTDALGAYR